MLSNSVCNDTHDYINWTPLCGYLVLLSLVWLQTEADSTQSYYHHKYQHDCDAPSLLLTWARISSYSNQVCTETCKSMFTLGSRGLVLEYQYKIGTVFKPWVPKNVYVLRRYLLNFPLSFWNITLAGSLNGFQNSELPLRA